MENKKLIVSVGLGAVVIAGLVLVLQYNNKNSNSNQNTSYSPVVVNQPAQTKPQPTLPPPPPYVPKDGAIQPVLPLEKQADAIIDITIVGFSPDKLTIKKGQSIIWTSRDQYNQHQMMATGVNKYPEKGACGTVLDLCTPLKLGESWRITFNDVGTWTYADKLHPKFTGTIIVQ